MFCIRKTLLFLTIFVSQLNDRLNERVFQLLTPYSVSLLNFDMLNIRPDSLKAGASLLSARKGLLDQAPRALRQ